MNMSSGGEAFKSLYRITTHPDISYPNGQAYSKHTPHYELLHMFLSANIPTIIGFEKLYRRGKSSQPHFQEHEEEWCLSLCRHSCALPLD